MLIMDKKKISPYDYLIFRCIDVKKKYANGVIEGYPGAYALCDFLQNHRPEKEGRILSCPKDWEFAPFKEFKEGNRYVVERGSFNNLKFEHFIKCKPIYEVKNKPFKMIQYEERFGDDSTKEIADFFGLDSKEEEQLQTYQKAFGFSYRANDYEFIVVTKRSAWRYNIQKKSLYHEGHLAKNKVAISKGTYLQGWHRQKTGYLEDLVDALSYIADHDYGFTSELQGSAEANKTLGNEKVYMK